MPTTSALPFVSEGSRDITFGTKGFRSANRLVCARRTKTAILNLVRFCWKERLRSTVIKTSNSFSAKGEQFAILCSCPSHLRHSLHKISWKLFSEPSVYAFV